METRKMWTMPQAIVQQFAANEYVAACGEENKVYKFTCDAGGGVSGDVYLETNGEPGLQIGRGGDRRLGGYHACGTTHEADSTDGFLDGYYVVRGDRPGESTVTPVIVWRGPYNNNTHCTTNLDMSTWETAKS